MREFFLKIRSYSMDFCAETREDAYFMLYKSVLKDECR